MRLIDADALRKTLGITDMFCHYCQYGDTSGQCSKGSIFRDVCVEIDMAPTIYPCGDCRDSISTQAFYNMLREECSTYVEDYMKRKIERLSTVDPKRKGHWILVDDHHGFPDWKCSECGGFGRGDYAFCPCCGLPMEVQHDNQ